MLAAYVTRGVKAGVIAGLVFGLFVALVTNPLVAFADELGHEGGHAVGEHHDSAVSTTVTNGVSVVSGVLWGVLLGGVVFGIAYYFLEPAIPGTDGAKSYLLAAGGFVTVSGAPWLVVPPQPPGVEQALPTETRLVLYGGMMVAGALVCLLSGFVYGRLRDARRRVVATAAAVLPVGLLAIPAVLAPSNPAESTLSPELATGLVGMTVFGQALLWLLLAGTHARLRRRSTNGQAAETGPTHTDTAVTAD